MGEESNIQDTNTKAVEPNTQPADTKPADNNTPADTKPADAGTPTQEPKATEPQLTIESYDENLGLTPTDDVYIDKELVKSFKQVALENGIKPEVANKIAKLQFDALNAQSQAIKDLQNKWAEENNKTYGDNLKNIETNVGRVLAQFDKDGKFQELLAPAGALKSPAALAFLKAIGDKVLEQPSVNPNTKQTEEVNLDIAKTFKEASIN